MHFPAVPGTSGAWDLDNESPQTGSSVDAPPRPSHTTPDSVFGTEVSLYLERTRVCVPTLSVLRVLTGFSLFDAIWCPYLPLLQTVLRIHVLEAQDLIAKDRFLGEPVQIALTLDIASISSISESNMVSAAPLLVIHGGTLSSYVRTEQRFTSLPHLEWSRVGTQLQTQDNGRFS